MKVYFSPAALAQIQEAQAYYREIGSPVAPDSLPRSGVPFVSSHEIRDSAAGSRSSGA